MAEKIIKNKALWPVAILAILCIAALVNYSFVEKIRAAGDSSATSITVGNAAPYITSVNFHGENVNITPYEWTVVAPRGVYNVTTTFRVNDTNGCSDIATTTLFVYHSGIANCSTSAQAEVTNCYPSTSTRAGGAAGSVWSPTYGDGDLCSKTSACSSETYIDFWCTTSIYFAASSTDTGVDPGGAYIWMAFASTSDKSYEQANRATNSGSASVEMNSLSALEVSNDIAYTQLSAGQNSSQSWVTTTATTTGNINIEIKFHGGSLMKQSDSGVHIPAFKQQFTTTSNLTYGDTEGVITLPTSTDLFTGTAHDTTMRKSYVSVPGASSADNILWGIGIPSGQAAGIYSSTTYYVADSTMIVTP